MFVNAASSFCLSFSLLLLWAGNIVGFVLAPSLAAKQQQNHGLNGFIADRLRDALENLSEDDEDDESTVALPPELKADIRMISGCEDRQTSADGTSIPPYHSLGTLQTRHVFAVNNVDSFELPDPAGRAGGACTSALLDVLYKDHTDLQEDLSFVEVLDRMRESLEKKGFSQVPQLTASHAIDLNTKFDLVPDDTTTGTRRALLIGINYVGHEVGELSGCHNDVLNMVEYIQDVHGFAEDEITVLMDTDGYEPPTRENILNAYKSLVAASEPGDALFCHYSGHGAKIRDDEREEADGCDETLVPLDYRENGMIRDDDLYEILVRPLSNDVHLVCLMDCCHSGTVLDLPYQFKANGEFERMEIDETFDFDKFLTKLGARMALSFLDYLTEKAS